MGQVESSAAETHETQQGPSSSSSQNPQSPSLESLIAEASAYSEGETESLDAKAQKALECPCISELRTGPCGSQFSDAFLCFLKSTAEEKGSDCVHPFVALQNCIKVNPDAFSKDVLDGGDEVKKEEEPAPEYKIIPPTWARESHTPKPKL